MCQSMNKVRELIISEITKNPRPLEPEELIRELQNSGEIDEFDITHADLKSIIITLIEREEIMVNDELELCVSS